jgi:tripartite-type tricarboxylate transporter receptor subunit TctC
MPMTLHRRSLLALAAGACAPLAGLAPRDARAADAYPTRPIRWIVAYPAGGGTDFLARQLAPQMARQMRQAVVVDNRPGAAGIVGTEAASKAPGDGYTLLTGDNGTMVFHKALYKSLPYDPSDFVPVGFMASFPLILVVHPHAGFSNVRQWLAQVKRHPGLYSYASPGAGSPHHLAMELLKARTGTAVVHVPYRGTPLALQDVIDGKVPMMVIDTASGLEPLRAGRLKALAVLSRHRLTQLPEVPTLSEADPDPDLQDFEVDAWQSLFAPKDTPPEIVQRVGAEMRRAILVPDVRKRLEDFGLEVAPSDGPRLAAFIDQQTTFWTRLIQERHLSLQ